MIICTFLRSVLLIDKLNAWITEMPFLIKIKGKMWFVISFMIVFLLKMEKEATVMKINCILISSFLCLHLCI